MANEINVRELVLDSLLDIERNKRTLSEAVSGTLRRYQYMSKQERSFYTRLTEGTIEYQIQLDYLLNQISKTPMNKCKPLIRCLFRMSLYQIRYMNAVPDEAVCNEGVKLAKKRGFGSLSGYVNGVLRNLVRNKDHLELPTREVSIERYLSVTYSVPEWLVKAMLGWYSGEVTEGMLQAFLQEAPITVRVNQLHATVSEVRERLLEDSIQTEPGIYTDNTLRLQSINYMNRIRAFRQGDITVQDESSVLQGYLVQPKAGDWIMDICAAPGGKSLHAAERLWQVEQEAGTEQASGKVIARDLTEDKTERILENLERMQYPNVEVRCWDARTPDPAYEEKIDILIADVPCSGLGVIGRKQDIKYRIREDQLRELVDLQREILLTARKYVKPDGYLVYSTCTVDPMENEEQLQWLEAQGGWNRVDITGYLPERLRTEVMGQPGTDLERGYCTLLPGKQKCDGFFVALLQKTMER